MSKGYILLFFIELSDFCNFGCAQVPSEELQNLFTFQEKETIMSENL
jgi:hypothetical protein